MRQWWKRRLSEVETMVEAETEVEAKGEAGDTKEEEGAQLLQYIYKKVSLCASYYRTVPGIIMCLREIFQILFVLITVMNEQGLF